MFSPPPPSRKPRKDQRPVISNDPRLYHWLQARLTVAMDLHERGLIRRSELLRIETDATLGEYTGPIEYRDRRPNLAEEQKVHRLLHSLVLHA